MTEKIFNDNDIINSILFDCQCCLFLLDMTNKDSLTNLKKLVNDNSFEELSYLKIILVENKIDEEKEINEEEVDEFMKENNLKEKMKISIKNGTGIEDLSNKIKEYVNDNTNDIPINFSTQNINEFKGGENEKDNLKWVKTANIIFLGNSMVGKSSLFLRIDKNHFKECFMSSIGMDRIAKSFKYKKDIYKVNLWDTAGQDRFRAITKNYYKASHGIILIYDVTSIRSFESVKTWVEQIHEEISDKVVIYLVGNKMDMTEERKVSTEEGRKLAEELGLPFTETSAKTGENIEKIFEDIIEDLDKEFGNIQKVSKNLSYKANGRRCCK